MYWHLLLLLLILKCGLLTEADRSADELDKMSLVIEIDVAGE